MADETAHETKDGSGKAPRARIERVVRLLVALVVLPFVFYAVVMNVFLATPLFEMAIDREPETIDIRYRHGWSLIPGRIHATDLSIRGRDSNVEWILWLDEVTFDVSLLAFAKQHFDVSRARGRGISFRLRQRLDAPPASPEEVAGLPSIPGLGAYAVRPPKVETPDTWNDAEYHLWQPHLEDVVAEEVREVWIDRYRFEGLARIAGRFHLIPVRSVDIGPVQVDVQQGRAMTGPFAVADALGGGKLEVTVARFDPRTAQGEDILRGATIHADVAGMLPDVGRMAPELAKDVSIKGIAEVRRLAVHLQGGSVETGSQLDAVLPRATLSAAGHTLSSELVVTGHVSRAEVAEQRNRFDLRLEAPSFEVAPERQAPPARRGFLRGRAVATADSRALELAHPLTDLHGTLDLAHLELPDARALSRYLPAAWHAAIRSGHARGQARAEGWLAEKRASLSARVHGERLGVNVEPFGVAGDIDASAEADVNLARQSLRVHGVRVALTRAKARFTRPDALEGAPDLTLERLELSARAPHVSLVSLRHPTSSLFEGGHARGKLGNWESELRIRDARIPDLRSLQTILPGDGIVAIESGAAHLSADLAMAGDRNVAHGTADLALSRSRLRLNETHFAGDFRVIARAHTTGAAGSVFGGPILDLSGSRVQMRHVEVTHATTEASHWYGDAMLPGAIFRIAPEPRLDARILLDARDANPLLAILLRDGPPKILGELAKMPRLVAAGRLILAPQHFALRRLDARGGDLAVRGLYAVKGEHRRGAFIVEKGVLSAGIRLDDEGAGVRLFGLDDWLRDEAHAMAPLLTDDPPEAPPAPR
ncbi:hypothetical protein [Pendulispora albinea]|uniref:DUF3971 domain-containing protein n=1 Tax=Pendulispora albinea TaxID=2741071 RepID=A0ABZ2LPB1_9BACT